MKEYSKASEWFDGLYAQNKESQENIPWAKRKVNPLLQTYLDEDVAHKDKALVVGCGLGDDAKALALAGYDVTAIDVSQTALDLAQERCADVNIAYEKHDIFDLPTKYYEYFDFVFEAFTVQSLPVAFREQMVQAIADSVAVDGILLLVAHKREEQFEGPPWPLSNEDVARFKKEGLTELSYEIHAETSKISNSKFRVLYRK